MVDVLSPLQIRVMNRQPMAVLRLYKPTPDMVWRVGDMLGLALPGPLGSVQAGSVLALWTAPSEWLLVGLDPKGATDRLGACDALWHVADVTEGLTHIAITGTAARDLIAKGCSLDLHPRAMIPGQIAGTVLAQIDLLIHKVEEDRFDLFCDCSWAGHIIAWLEDASATMQHMTAV